MKVIVQIRKEVAAELRKAEPQESVVGAVANVLKKLQVDLRPLHPTVEDESLRTIFVVTAANAEVGGEVVNQLRKCRDIEAAYIKRASEEPS